MAKQQRRKPPRRPPPSAFQEAAQVDAELLDLARVLDEHRLDTNAAGWLKLPWKNGWNAISLAWEIVLSGNDSWRWRTDGRDLSAREMITRLAGEPASHLTRRTYYAIDDRLANLEWSRSAPAMRAVLRCTQLLLSNSHGGGAVYNDVLATISGSFSEAQMLVHRFNDVADLIGNEPITHEIEKLRNVFNIAWRRGLYHAAYALKPIV
jgi:hypothetical protein